MFLPFLKNHFTNKKIAREDFRDLLHGTLTRMAGQNASGTYTKLIAALQPHHDAYAAFLAEQDEALAARYGDTDAVAKILADFKAWAKTDLLVDVPYVFSRTRPNPQALTEFLPRGRKEYSGATLLTLPTLLQRVADLTAAHAADLGPALAARAAALQQAYAAARTSQGQRKGAVQDDSKQEKKLRQAAARQLKLNLLAQLTLHIDAPEEVRALYDPWIFTQPAPKPVDL
jgi:hypothetical protein